MGWRTSIGWSSGAVCATLVPAACAGDDTAERTKLAQELSSEKAALSIRYPAGWHVTAGPITQVGYPPQQLVITSYPLRQPRPDPNCFPQTALRRLPPDGAFVYLFEYPDYRGKASRLAKFPPRPERFRPSRKTLADYECFGRSYMLAFRERGRSSSRATSLSRGSPPSPIGQCGASRRRSLLAPSPAFRPAL